MTGIFVAIEVRHHDRMRAIHADQTLSKTHMLAEYIKMQLQYENARRRACR